ncbi:DNA polymerase delta, subunit 4-domain-containing protein [Phlebopus sp. FC_14]|nr:DNA polymerase delta, subunit 4-domain-containing protein [Phlebopus sp. FC_14]
MVSSRTSSSSSTQHAKPANGSNMKQGTLAFSSAKRTNSATNAKSKGTAVSSSTVRKEKVKVKAAESSIEEYNSDVVVANSTEEEPSPVTVPSKRTREGTKSRASSGSVKHTASKAQKAAEPAPAPAEVTRESLDVQDKAGRYSRYYSEVRAKMGYMEPIHSEGQNRIHQMLRFFDMSYEYGPCVGMTRLERWERAEMFGLNPPPEVREILLTKEGMEKDEYAQCVLYGEV